MHYISYVLSDTNDKEAVGSQLKIISPETREWDRLLGLLTNGTYNIPD